VQAVPLFNGGAQVDEQRRGRCSTFSAGSLGCLVGADADLDSIFRTELIWLAKVRPYHS